FVATAIFSPSAAVTDVFENETTTHVFDTYNFFVHPHWYQFPLVSDTWHYAIGVFISIVGIVGIFGNATVIYIFSTTKNLKTPSNMFIVNLALSDLIFSLVMGFPLLTISSFNKKWIWGNTACELYGLIGGIFGLMSITTLSAISVDRYYAIAHPLQAAHNMTRRKAFTMICLVWVWSLCASLPPLFGWGAYVAEGFQTSCTFDYLTTTPSNRTYIFFLYLFGFAAPVFVIAMSYILILRALRKHEQKMQKMAAKMKVDDIKANQEKTKAEVKIAKIAIMIVALFLLSWSPYATVALIGQFGPTEWVTPFLSELPVMLAKASAMHNPIVYALSHPKFREALYNKAPRIFSCCKPPGKSTPSASRATNVSRTMSGLSDTVGGGASDVSSCVSNLSDVHDNAIQMRRTGKGSDNQGTDNSSTQLIQSLVQALVGVTNQQNRQVVYLPSATQSSQSAQGADPNGVFMVDNGGQKIDIKTYLQEIMAAEKIAAAVDDSKKDNVEIKDETNASNEKEVEKIATQAV
ncbi:rhodopsin, GQ-coupled-like, partial [Saccostrea echinata]|uniref:rhodopsin, GQ-coupled-like n=1 Tax=Saccostrea echinata TaxID=191078 RepID=UPI002A83B702